MNMKLETEYYEPNMKLAGFAMIPNSVLFSMQLSPEAKTIYAILFSRTQLSASAENIGNFSDKNGKIFVYYPLKDMMRTLGTGRYTVEKSFEELKNSGLLETVRQGLGKANRLYVKIPLVNIDSSGCACAGATDKFEIATMELMQEPFSMPKPLENPTSENPTSEKPCTDFQIAAESEAQNVGYQSARHPICGSQECRQSDESNIEDINTDLTIHK